MKLSQPTKNLVGYSTMIVAVILMMASSCIYKGKSFLGDTKMVEGIVLDIHEGGAFDAVFRLNDGNNYYINRGLENMFTLEQLKTLTLNKEVTISYVRFGMNRDGKGHTWHLNKLAVGDSVIYNEMEDIPGSR